MPLRPRQARSRVLLGVRTLTAPGALAGAARPEQGGGGEHHDHAVVVGGIAMTALSSINETAATHRQRRCDADLHPDR